jgi:hypothetical protein
MANWKSGLGGAASGAAAGAAFGPWGAAIGGGIGGLLGLFGDDDSAAEDAARQRLKIFEDLKNQYLGPDSASKAALDRLEQLSKTGLSDEDRAAAYNLLDQADTMARGREDALREEQAQAGRGASSSGLDAALRAQASQAAAGRQTQGEVGLAGIAAGRRSAALSAFLEQKARNDQMLNQWKLAVAGGTADSLTHLQDLYERENYASTQNLYHGLDSLGGAALYSKITGKTSPGADVEAQHDADLGAPAGSTRVAAAPTRSATVAPAYDPSGATTASASAQRYAGGPMAMAAPRRMDQFGMYDLSPLLDDQYKQ